MTTDTIPATNCLDCRHPVAAHTVNPNTNAPRRCWTAGCTCWRTATEAGLCHGEYYAEGHDEDLPCRLPYRHSGDCAAATDPATAAYVATHTTPTTERLLPRSVDVDVANVPATLPRRTRKTTERPDHA